MDTDEGLVYIHPCSSVVNRFHVHYLWTAVLGIIAALWIVAGVRGYHGMMKLPRLSGVSPPADVDYPAVSVLVAARNEAARLPRAMASLVAQDYPHYEVIAVDDRSSDSTPQILDEFARDNAKLKVIHLNELPPGWLGKPHALYTAYEHSTGDWLVFTDADVQFAPDLLRGALALALEQRLDHLTLLCPVELVGIGEKIAVSYWSLGLILAFEPWRVVEPRSGRYLGVGAFQLLRRAAYEAIGTHRRLALEVVDDVKLAKLVKQAGFRSAVGLTEDQMRLRWQEGLHNVVRGLTKNAFAACNFRIRTVLRSLLGLGVFSILPFAAIPLASGLPLALAAVAACAAVIAHVMTARRIHISPLYGLTHPLGAAIMAYILLRSMVVTLWRGGVVWRGTFYPLDQLRKGLV